ncbi:MAG: hypothetical protein J6Q85_00295 [Clostridia bacterium]|nr:hypothetical protein [Clostridia bacterium]
MKKSRLLFVIVILMIWTSVAAVRVFAMTTGFSTEPIPEEEIESFLEAKELTLITDEPKKECIQCFSVNEDGDIAIGSKIFNRKAVCIYDSNGEFQYGYSFKDSGSFGVEFHNDVLNIYFVRSDVALAVNPKGEVLDIAKIQDTTENGSYWRKSVNSSRKKLGDTEYIIRNDIGVLGLFATSYSQLVIKDVSGTENIIYDVSAMQRVSIIIGIVHVVLLFFVVIIGIICGTIKEIRKQKSGR